MQKKSLCGLTHDEIYSSIKQEGYSFQQALSVAHGIYKKRIRNFSEMPSVPKNLKALLDKDFIPGIFNAEDSEISVDKTVKYLFRTLEGKVFETVFIPELKRNTVCVSTQAGCRIGCPYCLTAGFGFHGDLSAGEIVNQIISLPDVEKITHVVFMGMGEPMDNLEEVLKACEIISAQWGLSISTKNITVSTVGISSGIEAFLKRSECNLAVSLYSPFQDERVKIVPVEKSNPVGEIVEFMKNYPLKKKRRLKFHCSLLANISES